MHKHVGYTPYTVTTDLNFILEFQKIAIATAIGFAIMGFIGFFVKLIHIPINNIIVWVIFTAPISTFYYNRHYFVVLKYSHFVLSLM